MMRRLVMMGVLALLMVGCAEDEPKSSIVGVWELDRTNNPDAKRSLMCFFEGGGVAAPAEKLDGTWNLDDTGPIVREWHDDRLDVWAPTGPGVSWEIGWVRDWKVEGATLTLQTRGEIESALFHRATYPCPQDYPLTREIVDAQQ